jgi:LPXTG-motif cell wall-anchored protein
MAQAVAMTGFASALFSIAVLGTFALAAGGLYLLARRRERKQGLLMLVAALVLFANVLVWTL